ncbi:M15 family metallopeptidase [Lacticigenium naphthae]|uniref:M15 family metallopeptidase n=1 Tax=Lacticigenium naphthae TaxID=515351 RepID=UPI0004122315|nr:M15 family metallopeptidase [Lacticigenium naphthae]
MIAKKWIAVGAIVINMGLLTACSETSEEPLNEVDSAQEMGEVGSVDSSNVDSTKNTEENQADTTDSSIAENISESEGILPDLDEDLLNHSSLAVLVNKEYSLEEDYIPEDLVTVEVPTVLENPEIKQLRKEAAMALKEMFDAAIQENILLHARSGYRSYQTQVQLFNNYVSKHGEEAASRYSARPGESEHQTGLAMDVTSESVNYQLTEEFGETAEGLWLKEHAHEYGFIIRYPQGKEKITGYLYEPWHLRYVSEGLALEINESGLTYEEYLKEGRVEIEINE